MASEKIKRFKDFMQRNGFNPFGKKIPQAKIGITGHLQITAVYPDGSTKLLADQPNLVVNTGLNALTHIFSNEVSSANYYPTRVIFGDGNKKVAATDTMLSGSSTQFLDIATDGWFEYAGFVCTGLNAAYKMFIFFLPSVK